MLAAGAGATPVILQRSEETLGTMPTAVGRYFSGNGERLNTAVINEDRVREVLGLDRGNGVAYEANQVGKGPVVASWDKLDGNLPGVLPVLAGAALLPARPGHDPGPGARCDRPELVRRAEEGDAAPTGSRG